MNHAHDITVVYNYAYSNRLSFIVGAVYINVFFFYVLLLPTKKLNTSNKSIQQSRANNRQKVRSTESRGASCRLHSRRRLAFRNELIITRPELGSRCGTYMRKQIFAFCRNSAKRVLRI